MRSSSMTSPKSLKTPSSSLGAASSPKRTKGSTASSPSKDGGNHHPTFPFSGRKGARLPTPTSTRKKWSFGASVDVDGKGSDAAGPSSPTRLSSPSSNSFTNLISRLAQNVSVMRVGSLRKSLSPPKRNRGRSFSEGPVEETSPPKSVAESDGSFPVRSLPRGRPGRSSPAPLASRSTFSSFPLDGDRGVSELDAQSWRRRRTKPLAQNLDDAFAAESLPPSTPRPESSSHFNASSLKSPSVGKLSRTSSFQQKKDQIRAILGKSFSRSFAEGGRREGPEGFATELFLAVEAEDAERVRAALAKEAAHEDLRVEFVVNNQGFTPLDVAVMLGNRVVAKLLIAHGAREAPEFVADPFSRSNKILDMLERCERKIEQLTLALVRNGAEGSVSPGEEAKRVGVDERNSGQALAFWERQRRLFERMQRTFQGADIPGPPEFVKLEVAGSESLMITISEPRRSGGALVTMYKVEWSGSSDFETLEGELTAFGVDDVNVKIGSLIPGQSYFVRVSAMNLKGCGPARAAEPFSAVPSSWKEVCPGRRCEPGDGLLKLNALIDEILGCGSYSSRGFDGRSGRKRSFKNMFVGSSKMVKGTNPRRGFYLACLLYHENLLLVTPDGTLPMCKVDDVAPNGGALVGDLLWFMKVAATWDDVKSLQQEMSCAGEEVSDALQWRIKLIDAAVLMQSFLGIKNLGQVNYTVERDSNGVVVLLLVKNVLYPNVLRPGIGRWIPQDFVLDRISTTMAEGSSVENLMRKSSEIVQVHGSVKKLLPKGLHVGYLKLIGSMDQINIIVPEKLPNVPPHVKVRNNSNISKGEWQHLLSGNCNNISNCKRNSEFYRQLIESMWELQRLLSIPESSFRDHRLYTRELIELDEDRSLLIVLPPADMVCDLPSHGSQSIFSPFAGLTSLPLPFWEMQMMRTYREGFMRRYCRLSTLIDVRLILAQQIARRALSTQEINAGDSAIKQCKDQQKVLENCWKQTRWAYDMISAARSKHSECGIKLNGILACDHPLAEPIDDPVYAVPYEIPTNPGSPELRPNIRRKFGSTVNNNNPAVARIERSSHPPPNLIFNDSVNVELQNIPLKTPDGVEIAPKTQKTKVSLKSPQFSLPLSPTKTYQGFFQETNHQRPLLDFTKIATNLSASGSSASSNGRSSTRDAHASKASLKLREHLKSGASKEWVTGPFPHPSLHPLSKIQSFKNGTNCNRLVLDVHNALPTERRLSSRSSANSGSGSIARSSVSAGSPRQSWRGATTTTTTKTKVDSSSASSPESPQVAPNFSSHSPSSNRGASEIGVRVSSSSSSSSEPKRRFPADVPNDGGSDAVDGKALFSGQFHVEYVNKVSVPPQPLVESNHRVLEECVPRIPQPMSPTLDDASSTDRLQTTSSIPVFAAYYHGLPPGQKVVVPIQTDTVVGDVVRAVVKHLNKMVIIKGTGTPVYTDDDLSDFYLVSQIGDVDESAFDDGKNFGDVLAATTTTTSKPFVVKRRGEINGSR